MHTSLKTALKTRTALKTGKQWCNIFEHVKDLIISNVLMLVFAVLRILRAAAIIAAVFYMILEISRTLYLVSLFIHDCIILA